MIHCLPLGNRHAAGAGVAKGLVAAGGAPQLRHAVATQVTAVVAVSGAAASDPDGGPFHGHPLHLVVNQ